MYMFVCVCMLCGVHTTHTHSEKHFTPLNVHVCVYVYAVRGSHYTHTQWETLHALKCTCLCVCVRARLSACCVKHTSRLWFVKRDLAKKKKKKRRNGRDKGEKQTSRCWLVKTPFAVKKQGGKEKGENEKKTHLTSLVRDNPLGRQKSDWQVSCADQTSVKRDLL